MSKNTRLFAVSGETEILIGVDKLSVLYENTDGSEVVSNKMVVFDITETEFLISVDFREDQPISGSLVTVSGRNSSGIGYSFESTLLSVKRVPIKAGKKVKVWVLSRPEAVERKQQRLVYRVNVSLPTVLEWKENGVKHSIKATCVNVSLTGCKIHIPHKGSSEIELRTLTQGKDCFLSVSVIQDFVISEIAFRDRKREKNGKRPNPDSLFHEISKMFDHISATLVRRSSIQKTSKSLQFDVLCFSFADEDMLFGRFISYLQRKSLQTHQHE